MDYCLLEPEYSHDVIAQQLHSRELEHYHYDLDRQNFEHMLRNMSDGPARTDIQKRLEDTKKQMAIVEHIYSALKAQVTDEEAHQAALARMKAQREANKAKG